MSNSYTFTYNSEPADDNDESPFPSYTHLSATHEVSPDQKWPVILWQFCKFLEHTGFEGVRQKVKIEDSLTTDWLFEGYYGDTNIDLSMEDENSVTVDGLKEYCEALDKTDKDAQ